MTGEGKIPAEMKRHEFVRRLRDALVLFRQSSSGNPDYWFQNRLWDAVEQAGLDPQEFIP